MAKTDFVEALFWWALNKYFSLRKCFLRKKINALLYFFSGKPFTLWMFLWVAFDGYFCCVMYRLRSGFLSRSQRRLRWEGPAVLQTSHLRITTKWAASYLSINLLTLIVSNWLWINSDMLFGFYESHIVTELYIYIFLKIFTLLMIAAHFSSIFTG